MSIMSQEAKKQLGCVLHWSGQISSVNAPKSITSNGDVKQIVPFAGAGIGMFDGTGDYLTIDESTEWNFGTGDFTVRFWVYLPTLPSDYCILFTSRLGNTAETSYQWMCPVMDTTGDLTIYFSSNNSSWDIGNIHIGVISALTYRHIAIVRRGTVISAYLDGKSVGTPITTSAALYYNNSKIYIGSGFNGINASKCYLSEFEISNVARYTTSFTPPRRQLESDSNTKLLLHFNRNDSTFIDSSPSAHTITRYGDAKQLCSPCGSGVAYFDGTGDYLQLPSNVDFDFVSQDFAVACWFNSSLVDSNYHTIIGGSDLYGSASFFIRVENNNKIYAGVRKKSIAAQVAIFSNSTISTNTWYYVVLTRVGNVLRLYLDGIQQGVDTTLDVAVENTQNNPCVGRMGAYSGNWYFKGYISDLIVKKGTSSNGAVPIQPFRPDPYTKLLLHMDGTGNAFYDSSDPPGDNGFPILPDGVTVTPSGTFTTQKMKDGRNIWAYNGTSNYISLSDHDTWDIWNNDFTICVWVNFTTVSVLQPIFAQYIDANNLIVVYRSPTPSLSINAWYSSAQKFQYYTAWTPTINTWYHIAFVRSGSSAMLIYVNGVAQSVTTVTAWTSMTGLSTPLTIGQYATNYTSGNIKDLMIFKGRALTQDQINAIMKETYIY